MTVTIAIANLTIRPMNEQFYPVPLSRGTGITDRFALRIGNAGDALRTFPTPGPLIAVRNYMNWFCHSLWVLICALSYLTPDQPTGILRLTYPQKPLMDVSPVRAPSGA